MSLAEKFQIADFLEESNRIEGIEGTTPQEKHALSRFLLAPGLNVDRVTNLVRVLQPDARLRDLPGLNVCVGDYVAPRGGPRIREDLERLLQGITAGILFMHEAHCRYEELHPYTDGNGRSGRAVWLWQYQRTFGTMPSRSFLHEFYYQTLNARRRGTLLARRVAARDEACCHDCLRPYGNEHGFPDLVIPDDVWRQISPTGDEGGLLCPSCICKRLHDSGLSEVRAQFTSGPLGGAA